MSMSMRGRLVVRNVSFQSTALDLRELFSQFGDLIEVEVLKDAQGVRTGPVFVEFIFQSESQEAARALDGSYFMNRKLEVKEAVPKKFHIGEAKGKAGKGKTLEAAAADELSLEAGVDQLTLEAGVEDRVTAYLLTGSSKMIIIRNCHLEELS